MTREICSDEYIADGVEDVNAGGFGDHGGEYPRPVIRIFGDQGEQEDCNELANAAYDEQDLSWY